MHKTQLNLITAFVFWGVCSLACTACSQNNTIELSSYINQPISEITQVDNNFYKTDALYGTSYSNGAVNVYTNEDDDLTSSIIISAECNYSLYGVTFGMEIDKANQIANIACVSQTEDESKSKTLFDIIVKKIEVVNNSTIRFILLGDIELTETINRKVRCVQREQKDDTVRVQV